MSVWPTAGPFWVIRDEEKGGDGGGRKSGALG